PRPELRRIKERPRRTATGPSSRPNRGQIQLDGVERFDSRLGVPCDGRAQLPCIAVQTIGLNRLRDGIQDPHVSHGGPPVMMTLARLVDCGGRWRKHLADPVWCQLEEWNVGDLGHPLTPPASEIGHHHLLDDMQLGLEKNDPTARPSPAPFERWPKLI